MQFFKELFKSSVWYVFSILFSCVIVISVFGARNLARTQAMSAGLTAWLEVLILAAYGTIAVLLFFRFAARHFPAPNSAAPEQAGHNKRIV
jgi:hypothetical protein